VDSTFQNSNARKKRFNERCTNVLDNGRISKPPEWNQDYEEYNYFISEEDSEGMKLTLKIAISKEKDMVTLVTVY